MKIKNFRKVDKNGHLPVIKARAQPCPFCGSKDLTFYQHSIYCRSCGARGPVHLNQSQESLAAWNERKGPQQFTINLK
jgi:Lar family restriction alleviation protein